MHIVQSNSNHCHRADGCRRGECQIRQGIIYRQRLTRIILQWMGGYSVGLFIIGLAFRVYDPTLEIAPTFLAIGQIVCAGSTVTTVFRFWKILG